MTDYLLLALLFRTYNAKFIASKEEDSRFCSDLSFWHDKCINGSDSNKYTNSRKCSYYETKMSDSTSESLCSSEGKHLCKKSSKCIRKDQLCDGIFDCFYVEDESFEICKDKFPEDATIYCEESNRPTGYNVMIMVM